MHKYFYSWKNLLTDQVIGILNCIGIYYIFTNQVYSGVFP